MISGKPRRMSAGKRLLGLPTKSIEAPRNDPSPLPLKCADGRRNIDIQAATTQLSWSSDVAPP